MGVFYFILLCIVLALIYTIYVYILYTRKRDLLFNGNFWNQLMTEVVLCHWLTLVQDRIGLGSNPILYYILYTIYYISLYLYHYIYLYALYIYITIALWLIYVSSLWLTRRFAKTISRVKLSRQKTYV